MDPPLWIFFPKMGSKMDLFSGFQQDILWIKWRWGVIGGWLRVHYLEKHREWRKNEKNKNLGFLRTCDVMWRHDRSKLMIFNFIRENRLTPSWLRFIKIIPSGLHRTMYFASSRPSTTIVTSRDVIMTSYLKIEFRVFLPQYPPEILLFGRGDQE